MAKFTGFDNTCDLSAVLGMLANASVFHTRIQTNAKDVRSMSEMSGAIATSTTGPSLNSTIAFSSWKRLTLCMGCPVDKDLMKLVSVEVTKLTQDVEAIAKSSADEAKKISEALQDTTEEINKFDQRITDIESRMEAERKEQLEKNQALSGEIGNISNNLAKVEKRQDTNEENIGLLGGKQSDLESTVSSLEDEQGENNNLFQISLSDMARQIGTFEKDFSNSLSRTLDWLRKREELWCLVVDNLDELEMSSDMRKLLTGHWKQAARGHIIITTRREATEIGEETGIEGNFCIELKCLTKEEGIQFVRMRTEVAGGDDKEIGELVRELGGLPLALDQAAAIFDAVTCP
ncbi:hypothetical protein OS493_021343 [Desmophyllum pertusum]|uniref:NB-ARC domain-containing protein n=1 Tax=Desmophyllum pertusum TaxID=174260 RepID=A0A9W9ZBY1_9CNID|nr:hypothetical protein OS493_021343 [Desmophyllum pertusum]